VTLHGKHVLVTAGAIIGLVETFVLGYVAGWLFATVRNFSVRIAMGASQNRLMRQLLSESIVIGAAAGGVVVAAVAARGLLRLSRSWLYSGPELTDGYRR